MCLVRDCAPKEKVMMVLFRVSGMDGEGSVFRACLLHKIEKRSTSISHSVICVGLALHIHHIKLTITATILLLPVLILTDK